MLLYSCTESVAGLSRSKAEEGTGKLIPTPTSRNISQIMAAAGAAAQQKGFQAFMNSPAGPKYGAILSSLNRRVSSQIALVCRTIFFWAPMFKWCAEY